MTTRWSTLLEKRDSYRVALSERPKSSTVTGVRRFGHDFPPVTHHACNVPIHRLHGWQEPLPVIFPGPISLVRKRLHSHSHQNTVIFRLRPAR